MTPLIRSIKQPIAPPKSQVRANGFQHQRLSSTQPTRVQLAALPSIKISMEELSVALRAKPADYTFWSGEIHKRTIFNLSSKHSTLKRSLVKDPNLLKSLERHTLINAERLQQDAAIPVFSMIKSPDQFRYVGSLGRMEDESARQNLIMGNYASGSLRLNLKAKPNELVTVPTIVAGNDDTLKNYYPLVLSDHNLIESIIRETAAKAALDGISENHPYSDTIVCDYNPKGTPNWPHHPRTFNELSDLANIPPNAKKLILEDNFAVIPDAYLRITRLSNHQYKSVGVIVVGISQLDYRDLNNQDANLKWTKEKAKYRLEKQTKSSSEPTISKVVLPHVKPIRLSRKEITQSLISFPKLGTTETHHEILANLPDQETVALHHLRHKIEIEKVKSSVEGIYIAKAIQKHLKLYPNKSIENTPVFTVEKGTAKDDRLFTYAGSVENLFAQNARDNIIQRNYGYYYREFDIPNSIQQLDVIIAGDPSCFEGSYGNYISMAEILLQKIIRESLQDTTLSKMKMGDLYSDIRVYKGNDSDCQYTFMGHLGEMKETIRPYLQDNNFTILPSCGYSSTPLTQNRLKSFSAIVLGTRVGKTRNLFDQNQSYY